MPSSPPATVFRSVVKIFINSSRSPETTSWTVLVPNWFLRPSSTLWVNKVLIALNCPPDEVI